MIADLNAPQKRVLVIFRKNLIPRAVAAQFGAALGKENIRPLFMAMAEHDRPIEIVDLDDLPKASMKRLTKMIKAAMKAEL